MITDKHGPDGPATGGAAPGPLGGMIHAPFTGDQVASLNNFQLHGMMHPFTCGSEEPHDGPRPALIAGTNGWTCPGRRQGQSCDYHQDWAHAFMADWSWKPHADAVRATLGDTPDPGPAAADDLPWPPWLENLSDEERIEAIVAAVAACYSGHNGPHDDGSADQHCTASMAEALLAKLLPASPGDGVSRWTVTRLGLIEALRGMAAQVSIPGYWTGRTIPAEGPVSNPVALADAILTALPADGESSTEAETPAQALRSLAAAFDRQVKRAEKLGLTRDGSIRARVLREAAGMARRRAQDGAESPHGAGAVSPDSGSGLEALSAADDDSDLTEDGWPL